MEEEQIEFEARQKRLKARRRQLMTVLHGYNGPTKHLTFLIIHFRIHSKVNYIFSSA